MEEKGGGRGWVNLEILLSNAPSPLFVDIPAICCRFLLQSLFSCLSISTFLIEAGRNILLFVVPGPSFFVQQTTLKSLFQISRP